ncbi:hypothetical protein KEM55_007195, partial [Ascosphaera atra]
EGHDPVDTPVANAGDVQAAYLAALAEEEDSRVPALGVDTPSAIHLNFRLSPSRGRRLFFPGPGGERRGSLIVHLPLSALQSPSSAPATPTNQCGRRQAAQQQEQQRQGQQGLVTPAQPQLPPQHSQFAPQPNQQTPAHLVQGYSFDRVGEAAGGFMPIFSPEEMEVLNTERRVYSGLGPEPAGKSDRIGNYHCVRH